MLGFVCQMLYQKAGSEAENRQQEELRERVAGEAWLPHCVSATVADLSHELKLLRYSPLLPTPLPEL